MLITIHSEAKELWRDFSTFLKNHPGLIKLVVAAILLVYGLRLLHDDDILIDSQLMFCGPNVVMKSMIGSGRYGIVASKLLFGLTQFVPFVSIMLMAICLGFLAVWLTFCIDQWSGSKKNFTAFRYLFPIFFLTGPCFAEQFIFTLQVFEVAFGLILTAMGVYFLNQWLYERKSPFWMFLSVGCFVWAFASYQIMTAFSITLITISFFLYYTEKEEERPWLWIGIKSAVVFITCLILYFIFSKLARIVTGTEELAYYVNGQLHWVEGIGACLGYIKGDFLRIMRGEFVVFHPFTAVISVLFVILGAVRVVKCKKNSRWAGLLALVLVFLSPFYLTIITGYYQPVRAQLVYPLAFAFWGTYLTTIKLQRKSIQQLAFTAAVLGCLIVTVNQANITTRLFQTFHMVCRNQNLLLNRIYARVEETADDSSMHDHKVIIIGSYEVVLLDDITKSDVIGLSFFDFDASGPFGVAGQIIPYAKTMGMAMAPANAEETEMARKEAVMHSAWPSKDSVWNMGDCVVVKLSD